ncbi:MAG: NUDIX domain-containing protein [Deltaproteobacteria bacterium]|nr:NUDIX domain-containing protein [Deltaproteobacteria bacterium]
MKKPTVAVVAVIYHGDLILGVSRPNDHQDFGLPGGSVDPGESAEQAMIREVKEETDLSVTTSTPLEFHMPGRFERVTAFVAEATGTMRSSDEGLVKWCTKEELMAGGFGAYNKALFAFLAEKP